MSDYRDDAQDTATISDHSWMHLYTVADDRLTVRDAVVLGIGFLVGDAVTVSDETTGRLLSIATEQVMLTEQWQQALQAHNFVADALQVTDTARGVLRTLDADTVVATDGLADSVATVNAEVLTVADEALGQRLVLQRTEDTLRLSDGARMIFSDMAEDLLRISDAAQGRAMAATLATDVLTLSDEVLGTVHAAVFLVADTAVVRDEAFGHLHAHQQLGDTVVVEDAALALGEVLALAWTAELGAWAMSRYAPWRYTGVAVIDGVAYATGPDGVYALDGVDEPMQAELRTAPLDMTPGQLQRPIESHLEYELQGAAQMEVQQTQSGSQAQTFSYDLPDRPAEHLTNARFRFGRGLRGRHYAYALRLTGTSAYINDWKVLAEFSKRSL